MGGRTIRRGRSGLLLPGSSDVYEAARRDKHLSKLAHELERTCSKGFSSARAFATILLDAIDLSMLPLRSRAAINIAKYCRRILHLSETQVAHLEDISRMLKSIWT